MAEHATPVFALPYPDPKGKVKIGPADLQELAERADTVFSLGTQNVHEVGDVKSSFVVPPAAYWLECTGVELSQTAYATLYAAIKGKYGVAAAGKFKIPNLIGGIPFGANGGTLPFGGSGGTESVKLASAQSGVCPHQHKLNEAPETPSVTLDPNRNSQGFVGLAVGGGGPTSLSTTGANAAIDAAEAHPNLPPYVVVRYFIRYA